MNKKYPVFKTDYEKWQMMNRLLNTIRKAKGLPLVTTPNKYLKPQEDANFNV